MKLKVNQTTEKVTSFFMESLRYYGKEINLQSNQHFSIDQVVNKEKVYKHNSNLSFND